MRTTLTSIPAVVTILLLVPVHAWPQDVPNSHVMPGNEAPAGPHVFYWGPPSATAPHGRSENAWRYRLWDGRWWYWTTDESWSYFNGDIWVPYTPEADRLLSRRPLIGPIAGPVAAGGVIVRGSSAGLTLIPGDHAGAPHLKRGTVLPKYLKQQPLPEGERPGRPPQRGPLDDAAP